MHQFLTIVRFLTAPFSRRLDAAEKGDVGLLEHHSQVNWIARRAHESIQRRVAGMGLIAVIDHFDLAQNLQLKTYAEHKIRGCPARCCWSAACSARPSTQRSPVKWA
jgi:hypothetical protein